MWISSASFALDGVTPLASEDGCTSGLGLSWGGASLGGSDGGGASFGGWLVATSGAGCSGGGAGGSEPFGSLGSFGGHTVAVLLVLLMALTIFSISALPITVNFC